MIYTFYTWLYYDLCCRILCYSLRNYNFQSTFLVGIVIVNPISIRDRSWDVYVRRVSCANDLFCYRVSLRDFCSILVRYQKFAHIQVFSSILSDNLRADVCFIFMQREMIYVVLCAKLWVWIPTCSMYFTTFIYYRPWVLC